jgi:CHAD domain-containing protein
MIPPSEPYAFELPWNVKISDVIAGLPNDFLTTAASTSRRERTCFFDTFDWRLYSNGLSLARIGDVYRLRDDGGIVALESNGVKNDPRFWWDFPEGKLRDKLRDILNERAAMPVGEVALRSRVLPVLNADDKTVARIGVETGEAFDGGRTAARIRLLNIVPVRGYSKEARRLAHHLSDKGLRAAKNSVFVMAVVACGRKPGDYTSKLKIQLDPAMSARHAAGVVFEHLLDTVERNVAGIREDIDTEFLHDFRVAIRRTRSGLTQLGRALPEGVADQYAGAFAELGRSTNRLRDLDVYLLSRDRYRGMLTEDLRPGLDPLFEELARERAKRHAELVRVLDGSRYRDLVCEWRTTLRTIAADGPRDGAGTDPVEKLADKVIKKRFDRVLRKGRLIKNHTPDKALHALRIDCKKLRYMLEFFSSLYARQTIGDFIKQLKRLQDNLGEFNDLSVQQAELKSFLRGMRSGEAINTAAAIGALVAKLEHRQHTVRHRFAATFKKFAGAGNQKRFGQLFASRQG